MRDLDEANKQPLQAETFQLIWFRSEILHLRSRMKERFPGLPVPSLKSDVIVSDEFPARAAGALNLISLLPCYPCHP